MAVETAVRPQSSSGQWSSIFPSEQISEQQSALFVKKLLAVGVSTITYLRTIFPEHAFGDRCLEDLNLKILRDDSSCPGACSVIKWMKGCFDALDKKYLRALILGLYVNSDDPDTVIESYTFKFSYTETGPNVNIYRNDSKIAGACSEKETKKATLQLLRTIIVLTQSLKLLPDEALMTMKLLYYDEVTPPDYEPPGFQAAAKDHFNYEEEPMNIKVGDVATPFHSVKLRMKTDKKQFDLQEADETQDDGMTNGEINDKGLDEEVELIPEQQSPQHHKQKEPKNCNDVPTESPTLPAKSDEATLIQTPVTDSKQNEEEYLVNCPCGLAEDDGLMIRCEICEGWQHAVCFKILSEAEAPEKHLCCKCVEKSDSDLVPTDPYLTSLKPVAVRATCLWRRALLAATEFPRIVVPTFAKRLGVEVTVARGLVNRLEREGFCGKGGKGKRLGQVVKTEKLKGEGFTKYFKRDTSNKVQDEGLEKGDVNQEEQPMEMDSNKHQEEVNNLTEKASQLQVSTRSLSKRKQKNEKAQKVEVVDVASSENKPLIGVKPVKTRGKKTSQKRAAISGNEFEISDSQDASYSSGRKRRKASSVSRPVVV